MRVTDSTSVNIFKALAAALALTPGRRRIVSQADNFPTDLYVASGLASLLDQGHELRLVPADEDPAQALDDDTAVLLLTHIDYRTGAMLDMVRLTAAAHAAGALTVWDLAHSAGAVPLDLAGAGADFAVGCGYKYLNGGPGAPAFLYVAPRHQGEARNPLTGWFAHAEPFAVEPGFRPADDLDRFLCGTPPVLSMVALEAALELWEGVDMDALRTKSLTLGKSFAALVGARSPELVLASPRDPHRRGAQVSFRHPEAYCVVRCLIGRGVTGDFRAPDIARFGLAPLTTRHVDVWDAAERIADVMESRAWDAPRWREAARVT